MIKQLIKIIFSITVIITISTPAMASDLNIDHKSFNSILQTIKKDISYSDDELTVFKDDYKVYYKTIIKPRIDNLKLSQMKRIELYLDKKEENEILLWTEGLALSEWYHQKEYIYILAKIDNKWVIASNEILDGPTIKCKKSGKCNYAYSKYYKNTISTIHPNGGACIFALYSYADRPNEYYMIVPHYNHYENNYGLSTYALPYPVEILTDPNLQPL